MSNLILGISGQIGGNLAAECELRQQPFEGTWYRWPQNDATPLDIRDAEAVAGLIGGCQPEVVYLVAGMNRSIMRKPTATSAMPSTVPVRKT